MCPGHDDGGRRDETQHKHQLSPGGAGSDGQQW